MKRAWPALVLIAIGVLVAVLAPLTQDCIYWSDGSACDDGLSIVVLGAGVTMIAAGLLWSVLGNRATKS